MSSGHRKSRSSERDKRISALVRDAKRLGASEARVISTRDVYVDERVRFKCMVPLCGNFGRHLMCPPSLISLDDFRRTLQSYRSAILLQLEAEVDSRDKSSRRLDGKTASELQGKTGAKAMEKRLHALVGELETLAFKGGFYLAAGLIGSECLLCDKCVGQTGNEPCRHPFMARPSMQALGIDVIRTAEKAGMPVRLSSSSKVRWTGLLLLY